MLIAVAVLVAGTVGAVFALGRGGGESAQPAFAPAGVVSSNDGEALPETGSLDDFARCLEEQGVALPQPGTQGQRLDGDTLRSAFEACRAYAPEPRGGHGYGPPDDGDRGELDSDTPSL